MTFTDATVAAGGTYLTLNDSIRLLRLSRKWALSGAFSRNTSKQAAKALDAAERLDAAALSARWEAVRRR